jgi:hypothetical protein
VPDPHSLWQEARRKRLAKRLNPWDSALPFLCCLPCPALPCFVCDSRVPCRLSRRWTDARNHALSPIVLLGLIIRCDIALCVARLLRCRSRPASLVVTSCDQTSCVSHVSALQTTSSLITVKPANRPTFDTPEELLAHLRRLNWPMPIRVSPLRE